MSVINQMLKDLDKRNAENTEHPPTSPVVIAPQASNKSPIGLVIISVIVTLAVVAFVWLYQENQQLKQTQPNQLSQQSQQTQQLTQAIEKLAQRTESKESANQQVLKTPNTAADELTQPVQQPVQQLQRQVKEVPEKPERLTSDEAVGASNTNTITAASQPQSKNEKQEVGEQIAIVKGADKPPVIESSKVAQASAPETKPKPKSTSSLSIARKQLTSQELAAQKMMQAEKAMLINDGETAEQLMQDALLLSPENKEARKQLAALWYAKRQYQPALNILNQGIHLDSSEPDFRIMKAKILLQQNFAEQAYLTLSPLSELLKADYQALLANAAQQANNTEASIKAYQNLTQLQPAKAKWFLGLAIALDRNSQFEQAVGAYQQALSLGDISTQSRQFAKQRIIELGD